MDHKEWQQREEQCCAAGRMLLVLAVLTAACGLYLYFK